MWKPRENKLLKQDFSETHVETMTNRNLLLSTLVGPMPAAILKGTRNIAISCYAIKNVLRWLRIRKSASLLQKAKAANKVWLWTRQHERERSASLGMSHFHSCVALALERLTEIANLFWKELFFLLKLDEKGFP
jgi:hypothetical protein